MAQTIVNPKDTDVIIQLNDAINAITNDVGFMMNSGLFEVKLTPRDAVIEQINQANKRGMLGLTSKRERNKVKQTKRKTNQFAVQTMFQSTIENLTFEDVDQVAGGWDKATELQINDLMIDKMTAQRESMDSSQEFMVWTASQGITLNPKDGSEIVNMFDIMEVTRPVVNVDLTDVSLNLLAWMGEFRNRVMKDNKRSNNQGEIEIFVTDDVFTKFVSHPSVYSAYQMAYQGRGREYLDNVATPFGTTRKGNYGIVRDFAWEGVRLIVAPQDFILEEAEDLNDTFDAVAEDSGFAVVRGIRDSYKLLYSGNNSLTNPQLARYYAVRSPIIEDSYFEITASSAPTAYTTIPELCYEFKFKTK